MKKYSYIKPLIEITEVGIISMQNSTYESIVGTQEVSNVEFDSNSGSFFEDETSNTHGNLWE